MQILFGALLLVHLPNLDPFSGYVPLRSESIDDNTDETVGADRICPERYASILSSQWVLPFSFNPGQLILKWFHLGYTIRKLVKTIALICTCGFCIHLLLILSNYNDFMPSVFNELESNFLMTFHNRKMGGPVEIELSSINGQMIIGVP